MKKNCECNCDGTCTGTTCKNSMNKKGFYIGVKDYEIKCGTINDMEVYSEFRVFNDKFVETPELALLLAFDENNERWKKPAADIMKNVVYDPCEKEWKRVTLQTTNGHLASPKQIKKWNEGEYVLELVTEYVQILKTDLIGYDNMTEKACEKWEDHMNKLKTPKN